MMTSVLLIIGMIIVSYLIGCFSTARLITKHFKLLNIYKVGTGHPDTENIYLNVSKTLGVVAGIVDAAKMYFFLFLLKYFYNRLGINGGFIEILLLVTGFAMIVGHCLPVTNKFKGGRGLFTFIGYGAYFILEPMAIVVVLAIIFILIFKQIRFAQYMVVLLPAWISYFFPAYEPIFHYLVIVSIMMGGINYIVSKRLGEI